jgi:hypothetical protein
MGVEVSCLAHAIRQRQWVTGLTAVGALAGSLPLGAAVMSLVKKQRRDPIP